MVIRNQMNWQPTLENELVLLRPLESLDYDALFLVASDPLLWEQHPSFDRYKPEVFQPFFEQALAAKKCFIIIDKKTERIIGSSRYYDFNSENQSVKIGYSFLDRSYWGGNFNFAHKQLLIDHAFQMVSEIIFEIGETNFRSQKGTEKLGVEKITHFLKPVNGELQRYIAYVLTKENWDHACSSRKTIG